MRELIHCTPRFLDLFNLKQEMDKIFDVFGGRTEDSLESDGFWSPVADVIEDKDSYLIKAELPGIKEEDIKLTIQNNLLTLRGERSYENGSDDKHAYRRERYYGSFSRSFRLPQEIQTENINATYKDGLLKIVLPKSEKVKPKEIKIKVH